MACVGGTIEEPRVWYRLVDDTLVRKEGRACFGFPRGVKGKGGERRSRFTSVYSCSTCIAYRGPLEVQPRGSTEPVPYIGALYPDGKIHNLTEAEFEAQFDYDEIEDWFDSLDPARRSPMTTASRSWFRELDDEARNVWNEYIRRYREEHPDRQRSAEARYRAAHRAELAAKARKRRRSHKSVQVAHNSIQSDPGAVVVVGEMSSSARARGMQGFMATEGGHE